MAVAAGVAFLSSFLDAVESEAICVCFCVAGVISLLLEMGMGRGSSTKRDTRGMIACRPKGCRGRRQRETCLEGESQLAGLMMKQARTCRRNNYLQRRKSGLARRKYYRITTAKIFSPSPYFRNNLDCSEEVE